MSLGSAVRQVLPTQLERWAARAYRSVFVDLDKVAECASRYLPAHAAVLDIGGGDGDLLNRLLARRPDLKITMVDVAQNIGRLLEQRFSEQVVRVGGTTVEKYISGSNRRFDGAIVSDVMHHLQEDYRSAFLSAVANALAAGAPMLVKDIEPGHAISWLSVFADKYVSGDRDVKLIGADELATLATRCIGDCIVEDSALRVVDPPNYLLVIRSR